jgi:hypothetical protein
MGKYIGIGMTQQAQFMRNIHATQYKLTARHQGMHVSA